MIYIDLGVCTIWMRKQQLDGFLFLERLDKQGYCMHTIDVATRVSQRGSCVWDGKELKTPRLLEPIKNKKFPTSIAQRWKKATSPLRSPCSSTCSCRPSMPRMLNSAEHWGPTGCCWKLDSLQSWDCKTTRISVPLESLRVNGFDWWSKWSNNKTENLIVFDIYVQHVWGFVCLHCAFVLRFLARFWMGFDRFPIGHNGISCEEQCLSAGYGSNCSSSTFRDLILHTYFPWACIIHGSLHT